MALCSVYDTLPGLHLFLTNPSLLFHFVIPFCHHLCLCLEGRIIGNLDTLLKQTEFLHSDHLEKHSETQALNELSFTQV